MALNKATVIGNLGGDPQMRSLPSGDNVANFSVATTERFKDRSGERRERTEWHRIVVFGKLADTCAQDNSAKAVRSMSKDGWPRGSTTRRTAPANGIGRKSSPARCGFWDAGPTLPKRLRPKTSRSRKESRESRASGSPSHHAQSGETIVTAPHYVAALRKGLTVMPTSA